MTQKARKSHSAWNSPPLATRGSSTTLSPQLTGWICTSITSSHERLTRHDVSESSRSPVGRCIGSLSASLFCVCTAYLLLFMLNQARRNQIWPAEQSHRYPELASNSTLRCRYPGKTTHDVCHDERNQCQRRLSSARRTDGHDQSDAWTASLELLPRAPPCPRESRTLSTSTVLTINAKLSADFPFSRSS